MHVPLELRVASFYTYESAQSCKAMYKSKKLKGFIQQHGELVKLSQHRNNECAQSSWLQGEFWFWSSGPNLQMREECLRNTYTT